MGKRPEFIPREVELATTDELMEALRRRSICCAILCFTHNKHNLVNEDGDPEMLHGDVCVQVNTEQDADMVVTSLMGLCEQIAGYEY